MKKKLVAMFLVLSLILVVLAGCNTGTTNNGDALKDEVSKNESWPQKPIQIIVPFKPGGDSDFNARTIGEFLEAELGVSVIVSNVDGSGGSIGTKEVKDAKPDGYTMLSNHNSFLINQANEMSDFGFEAFELVGIYAANPGDIIAVSSEMEVNNLDELVAKTEENPGVMTVATNIGATTQVSSFMLAEAGAKIKQVDVGGITDKIASLLGGHVDIILGPYGNIKPYLDSGEMIALGVTSKERAKAFPDIPTCIEQGYEVYFPTRFFLAFPEGTDQEIVNKMSAAVEKIVTTNEEYAEKIFKAFYETPLFLGKEEALKEYSEAMDLINRFSLTSLDD